MVTTEIKPNFDVSIFEEMKPDFRSLFPLPKGWRMKTVSEKDPRITPECLTMGQTGMMGRVIVIADQEGIERGRKRVIFTGKGKRNLPRPVDSLH